MNGIMLSLVVGIVFLAGGHSLEAALVVVPNANAAVEANLSNRFPLLVNGGQRYQQVYAASQFGSLAPGGELITSMALRPDSSFGSPFGPITINPVTISLSTVSIAPDSLSAIFANNVGPDNTVVRSGSVTISSADAPGPGNTRAFDTVINFITPFFYNPANGNLLLDMLNSDPSNNSINVFFDAELTNNDSVSRVFGSQGNPGAASGSPDSLGLVTQFSTTPAQSSNVVPEPSSLAIWGLISTGLAFVSYRCRRHAPKADVPA